LGGDEFVMILQNISSQADVDTILDKITELLRKPMSIADREIQITASMGVALYPLHDDSIDGLICKADAAMYEVKQRGRNDSMVYSVEINQDNIARMSMETQLRMALDAGELSLYYQPQVMIPDYQVVGVEALMRWHHPELGMVSPAEFIPIAEETGLIIPIGDWLLREACSQQLRWVNMGLPPIRVAVNISAVQFQEPHFCERVKQIIEFTGIDPQYLELELTESVVMKSAEKAIEALTELRGLGIKLAIDDFGTGYSSLSYLRKFPIDRIKIDKSFIRNIKDTPVNEAIVRAIIALGESLGLSTIDEGVENNEELECVTRYNCCEVQGYRFAKPLPLDAFVECFFSFMKSAINERKSATLGSAN
jgi:predicted signal transduction protein with EAL and GGDEF domain